MGFKTMAAATDIAVYDGQSTPLLHTFSPARKTGSLVVWEERTTNHLPNGFFAFGVSSTSTKGSSPIIRQKVTLSVPIEKLDSNTGMYSYPAVNRFAFDFMIPKESSQANRSDFAAYVKNFMAHAVIQNMIANLDQPF